MFIYDGLTTLFAIVVNLAFVTVEASPVMRRDVIAPTIITPNANTVWTVGAVETVTWDTSNFPPESQITNPIGEVILGYEENNSLNLDFDNPLATGFNLTDGTVQVTVPDVPPRNDYIVVLFGDSGDTSPAFTITSITGGSSVSPSSSSSASSPDPSSDNTPPVSSISSSVIAPGPALPSQALSADALTPSSSVPLLTSGSSSSSSSSATPAASSVSATSSATSLLTPNKDKSKLMILTSCILSVVFALLV